jgi:glucosamine--fructose-6-phosphate aminotransferase (isomerizing)
MCGIVGGAARRDIVPVLLDGLRRLEYRGYDSCGVAMVRDQGIGLVRTVSRVNDLAAKVNGTSATTAVAHTRWATHGAPATENAHPIVSRGDIAVVHNGIIENYEELRAELRAAGYRFESQTDTEVIAHLVQSLYEGDLLDAVRRGENGCDRLRRASVRLSVRTAGNAGDIDGSVASQSVTLSSSAVPRRNGW